MSSVLIVLVVGLACALSLSLLLVRRLADHHHRLRRLEELFPDWEEPSAANQALVGQRVADFTATRTTGETVTSDALFDEVQVLAFLSAACPPCHAEAHTLADWTEAGRVPSTAAVVSGTGPELEAMVEALTSVQVVIVDESSQIGTTVGVAGTPTFLELDGQARTVIRVVNSVQELVAARVP